MHCSALQPAEKPRWIFLGIWKVSNNCVSHKLHSGTIHHKKVVFIIVSRFADRGCLTDLYAENISKKGLAETHFRKELLNAISKGRIYWVKGTRHVGGEKAKVIMLGKMRKTKILGVNDLPSHIPGANVYAIQRPNIIWSSGGNKWYAPRVSSRGTYLIGGKVYRMFKTFELSWLCVINGLFHNGQTVHYIQLCF